LTLALTLQPADDFVYAVDFTYSMARSFNSHL